MKVYGPYRGNDGRWRCIIYDNGNRKTVSYPKMLMESYLGRKISSCDDIHHRDGNTDNNNIENLEIISRIDHCRQHAIKYNDCEVYCVYCGKLFNLSAIQLRTYHANKRRGKNGPFCSRQCSGKYGTDIQKGYTLR